MAESASRLKRRREQLWASLPALSQTRADTYRLNSDALTLGRTGATYQDPRKLAQLGEAEVTADDAMRGVRREIRQLDEEIGKIGRASDGASGAKGRTRRATCATRPMNDGLFEIRLGGRPAAAAEQSARRAEPPFRQAGERGLHRYCSGCSQETEHVLCRGDDGPSIPPIRWPAAEPASGTTMCVDCGQWRAPASRPNAPAWSFWPRRPAEPGGVLSISKPDREAPLESAAENEGMPPVQDPTRLGRRQPARTMKKAIATY